MNLFEELQLWSVSTGMLDNKRTIFRSTGGKYALHQLVYVIICRHLLDPHHISTLTVFLRPLPSSALQCLSP